MVKASYVRLAGGGAKAARAHLAYIERDGVERDGTVHVRERFGGITELLVDERHVELALVDVEQEQLGHVGVEPLAVVLRRGAPGQRLFRAANVVTGHRPEEPVELAL